jgi:hypothetical protein
MLYLARRYCEEGVHMNLIRFGLCLNFIGAGMVGFSSQFGMAAGLGGPIGWKNSICPFINLIGWILLVIGFGIQIKYVR